MAPARAKLAFHAMKDLGIAEDVVKPVLKKLIKLYDKKWELIEEENYRVLADAIFEGEETKATEEKNKLNSANKQDNIEEEEPHELDEPERPLKRLRRNHDGQGTSSVCNFGPSLGGTPNKESNPDDTMEAEPRAATGNQAGATEPDPASSRIHCQNKGKEPVSPQNALKDKQFMSLRPYSGLQFKENRGEPGVALSPKQKFSGGHEVMKLKDEPFDDDLSHFEIPLAVISPEPSLSGASLENNFCTAPNGPGAQAPECENGQDVGEDILVPPSSGKKATGSEHADVPAGSNLDIASSSSGEVKISININSTLGRPQFHQPNLDAVVKEVEDRCLRSHKVIDPNFSLRELMKDVCECFLELGTDPVDERQERTSDVGLFGASLKISPAPHAICHEHNADTFSMQSCSLNGSLDVQCTDVAGVLQTEEILPSSVGNNGGMQIDVVIKDSCAEVERNKQDPDQTSSLVVSQQSQLTPHDMRLLHDVHDISRGEEKVKIPWKNEINNENPPPFHYILQNLVFRNARVNISLSEIGDDSCCSTCFGNCLSSAVACACTHEFGGEYAYTLGGLIKEVHLEECKGHVTTKIIRECWSKCGCHKECGNRLIQRGISCKLQVFLTPEGKGWGLQTLEDLPKGAFVCEYVGEILTHTELRERKKINNSEKHAYTVLLDAGLKDKEALCLDARYYGNVARFINHRCSDANLVEVPVQVETPDHHYYHLAFFTSRKINALEELTWDYGVDFGDHNHSAKAFRCLCGSQACRDLDQINLVGWIDF